MRLRIIIILAFFTLCGSQLVNAQSCRDLCKKAKSFDSQKRLEKAKKKYRQVVNCGDKLYYADSKDRIEWINRKPDPFKPFSISNNEVVIPYHGDQDVITVDGKGSRKTDLTDGENDWCKIKKEKGKGMIYIISYANISSTERYSGVSISMGGKTKKVTVKNEKAPKILIPSVENVTFPYNGETNSVEIISNYESNNGEYSFLLGKYKSTIDKKMGNNAFYVTSTDLWYSGEDVNAKDYKYVILRLDEPTMCAYSISLYLNTNHDYEEIKENLTAKCYVFEKGTNVEQLAFIDAEELSNSTMGITVGLINGLVSFVDLSFCYGGSGYGSKTTTRSRAQSMFFRNPKVFFLT